MKFREKINHVLDFSADLLVIPECEAPDKWRNSLYMDKINQFLWFGDNANKGIGVLMLNSHFTLEIHPAYTEEFKYIIPLKVSGQEEFNLIAIWSQRTEKQYTSYIGQIYKALKHYESLLNDNCMLVGDWNSNKIFDHLKRVGTHSEVVDLLNQYSIHSTYHTFYKEEHGEETLPTYYFRKEKERPFHLDFIFASKPLLERLNKVEVGTYDNWIRYSDHVPIFVEFDSFGKTQVLVKEDKIMANINSDRFLSAFNNIHDFIKKESGSNRHVGFTEGLNKLRHKNFILARCFDDLQVFNDLRNVIVHRKNQVEYSIAEPHIETVINIENILGHLIKPERVYPKYASNVKSFTTDESLTTILIEVNQQGYSQFPIYDDNGQFIGLLTENGITNWLSRSLNDDLISISDTKINDVIQYEEIQSHFLFVSRNISVFEAKEKFLNHLEVGTVKLDALLITENGKKTETLLGIITPWDVLEI